MKPTYPSDHTPAMAVPKGGSSCASCEYFKGVVQGKLTCGNSYFLKWNGSNRIPAKAPDEYCSDWYEPKQKQAANLQPMHVLIAIPKTT